MKKVWIVLASLALLAGCSAEPPAASNVQEKIDVPDFTLKSVEGKSIALSSFRGVSPVLLAFWATWCPYCKEEMPNLVELKTKYGGKLEIMAIDIQETQQQVAAYIRGRGFNFDVLLDEEGTVAGDYGLVGVPTLVLVDKEGKGVVADNSLSSRILDHIKKLAV